MKCSIYGYGSVLLILLSTLLTPSCASRKAVSSSAPQWDDTTPVATLQDRVITGGELRERIIKEVRPNPYALHTDRAIVDPKDVVDLMLRETAMVLDAREQGLLNDPSIARLIERIRTRRLINRLARSVIRDQVDVTDEQIEAQLRQTPKLDRDRARMTVEARAIRAEMSELIKELPEQLHVQKNKDNIAQAAQVYRRLLLQNRSLPTPWVKRNQILNEVDPNQARMTLVTFDGGQYTLMNLLLAIDELSPPKRPRNLSSPQGMEQFLDKALNAPLLVAYARSLDLDKDEDVAQRIRDQEDHILLGQIRSIKTKGLAYPTEDKVKAYFDRIKDTMKRGQTITAKVIWCPSREAAQSVRQMLNEGRTFDQVKADYGSDQEQVQSLTLSPQSEGIFWKDLWSVDPNTVVGPLAGFNRGQFQWRVVKVLEKTEGKALELDDDTSELISGHLYQTKRKAALLTYQKALMEKYEHHVFVDRLDYFNPLK